MSQRCRPTVAAVLLLLLAAATPAVGNSCAAFPTSGVLAYWPLTREHSISGGIAESSPAASLNRLTISSVTEWGRTGVRFTGQQGQAAVSRSDSRFTPQPAFSVECLVKPTGMHDQVRSLVQQRGTELELTGWMLRLAAGGRVQLFLGDGSWRFTESSTAVEEGKWAHILFTYQAGQARMYLNGQQDGALTRTLALPDPAQPLRVAANTGADDKPFEGDMRDLAVHSSALSTSAVGSRWQRASCVIESMTAADGSADGSGSDGDGSGAVVAGIVVAVLLIVALVVGFFCHRRLAMWRKVDGSAESDRTDGEPAAAAAVGSGGTTTVVMVVVDARGRAAKDGGGRVEELRPAEAEVVQQD